MTADLKCAAVTAEKLGAIPFLDLPHFIGERGDKLNASDFLQIDDVDGMAWVWPVDPLLKKEIGEAHIP